MRVCTVQEMRELDARAVQSYGIPQEILMENAGITAASVIREQFSVRGRRFCVLCGLGNNGGDGLVVARHLHSRGGEVRVCILGDPSGYGGAAALNYGIVRRIGIRVQEVRDASVLEPLFRESDLVVDGIFGTGLSRDVEGLERRAIEAVNASGRPVLSLDIPSGVDGDTGQVHGAAVAARWTVTFGLPKMGNLLYPGHALGGSLFVSRISFPPELLPESAQAAWTNEPVPLPPRDPAGHKGSFGQALFVAGSRAYLGAPVFAAGTFLRAGGGYARLAAPASIVPALAASCPEVVFAAEQETEAGTLSRSCAPALLELARAADVTVLGPGLSLHEDTGKLATQLVRTLGGPLIVDGDGITHLAREPEAARERAGNLVLTPHPGELARLLGCPVAEVLADRARSAREAASRYAAVVVAKGAHTLIAEPEGRLHVNLSGNCGMATAGSGDVLVGVIAALCGLGLGLPEAARTAVFVHGFAGDLAAEELGEDGIRATDIMRFVPLALRKLRADFRSVTQDCYGKLPPA